jgi:hypothetical protein
MTAISTTLPTPGNPAALIGGSTPSSSSSSSTDPASSDAPTTATGDGRGAATTITLSDKVKAILAQAKTDQTVAERLQALVQARRVGGAQSSQADGGSKTDIDTAFQRLTGGPAQTADSSQTPSPVEPAINFADHAEIGGFSVSVTADARTGAFSTLIHGPDGLSFLDKRFGQNGEVSGGEGVRPGETIGEVQAGNVEYVTFAQSEAAAVDVSASSNSEQAAASATAAHSYSVTFAIDFTTGSIHTTQSELSTASVKGSSATSPLSIVA